MSLIDKRINFLFKSKYSKKTQLTIDQVFPRFVNEEPIVEYLVSRTLMRPRDLIDFVNTCIKCASQDEGYITEFAVEEAEKIYSKGRLDSLNYEWGVDYPSLKDWARLLHKQLSSFKVADLDIQKIVEMGIDYASNPVSTDIDSADTILNLCHGLVHNKISEEDFRKKIIYIFYRVSLVGLREPEFSKVNWSHLSVGNLQWDDIESDTEIQIHPCFRAALKTT